MDDLVKRIPTYGFARGSVVRKFGQGPNMLVVRQLEKTTVAIIIEDDAGGNVRLREWPTDDLEEVLPDHGRQDHEFDLRWQADRRAIERWRKDHPGKELIWPDHVDLVIWLAEQQAQSTAEITRLRAEVKAARKEGLEMAAKLASSTKGFDEDLQMSAGCLPQGKAIAAAIRALAEEKG